MRRPGNAGGRAGAGAGYGGVGRRQSPECPPAQPLMPGSSGISSERVWGGDAGPAGSLGQRGKEVIAPWSLTWKTGEAGSFHSSSSPLAGPVHPTNLPTLSDAHNIQEQVHKQGASSFSQAGRTGEATGLLLFLGHRAGRRSSLGGWEQPVLEGQGRGREDTGEGLAKDRGRARTLGGGAGQSQVLAALQLIGFLSIGGGWHTDVHHIVARGLIMSCTVSNLLL